MVAAESGRPDHRADLAEVQLAGGSGDPPGEARVAHRLDRDVEPGHGDMGVHSSPEPAGVVFRSVQRGGQVVGEGGDAGVDAEQAAVRRDALGHESTHVQVAGASGEHGVGGAAGALGQRHDRAVEHAQPVHPPVGVAAAVTARQAAVASDCEMHPSPAGGQLGGDLLPRRSRAHDEHRPRG